MSDPWTNDTYYDDEDVYLDYCPRLDRFPASDPMPINLYSNPNAAADKAQGGTKSHYTPVSGGITLYDTGNQSDYQFSVERLAWVDGWRESTVVDGVLEQKQPMTLIVLRFMFRTFNQDLRVGSVKATLQFKDVDRDCGNDPEVQAWAPFHDVEAWNASKSQNKYTKNSGASITGGYAGSSLSLERSNGTEVSWDRTHFDEGQSILLKSKAKQRPIGVTWSMKQNDLENLGVTPVVWAAVLIKRTTPDSPYLVKFRMDVRTGTYHDFSSKVKNFLWIKPGETSSFTATPRPGVWDKHNCFGEGEDLKLNNNIDLNNLGKLLDTNQTKLSGSLGPDYKRSAPSVKDGEPDPDSNPQTPALPQVIIDVGPRETPPSHDNPLINYLTQTTAGDPLSATAASNDMTTSSVKHLPPVANVTDAASAVKNEPPTARNEFSTMKDEHPAVKDRPQLPTLPHPQQPSYSRAYFPTAVGEIGSVEANASWSNSMGRLVMLEARAAQVEARVAAQDIHILQLQRAVHTRDARIAQMEQAVRVAGTALSQL